jgi:hypothetical protein
MTEAFERKYGVTVVHAWGMTEMSPIGSVCHVKPELEHLRDDALYDLKMKPVGRGVVEYVSINALPKELSNSYNPATDKKF